jgi:hypothetical protein
MRTRTVAAGIDDGAFRASVRAPGSRIIKVLEDRVSPPAPRMQDRLGRVLDHYFLFDFVDCFVEFNNAFFGFLSGLAEFGLCVDFG